MKLSRDEFCTNFGFYKARFLQFRLSKVGPEELRPAEVRTAEVCLNKVSHDEVRKGEVCSDCPAEARLAEVYMGEVRPREVSSGEVRLGEVHTAFTVLRPPVVPNSGSLLYSGEILVVGHSGTFGPCACAMVAMQPDIAAARFKLFSDEMLKGTGYDCGNLAPLLVEYGFCKQLLEEGPAQRMEYWRAQR